MYCLGLRWVMFWSPTNASSIVIHYWHCTVQKCCSNTWNLMQRRFTLLQNQADVAEAVKSAPTLSNLHGITEQRCTYLRACVRGGGSAKKRRFLSSAEKRTHITRNAEWIEYVCGSVKLSNIFKLLKPICFNTYLPLLKTQKGELRFVGFFLSFPDTRRRAHGLSYSGNLDHGRSRTNVSFPLTRASQPTILLYMLLHISAFFISYFGMESWLKKVCEPPFWSANWPTV